MFNIMVFLVNLCLLLLLCSNVTSFETLKHVKSFESAASQTEAVQSLIYRVIGERSKEVEALVLPSEEQEHVLLQSSKGVLKISGSSGVAVAYGFNYFLKYYCGAQLSWAGDQIKSIPFPLPTLPKEGVAINAGVKYRYYQNVCTVSYSSVWWNWTRWEHEIDWMALNGINLPLAFTGQEAIWQRVYLKLGFTKQDLDQHFAGPAFLAWGRMGNIHGWGGPLPSSWKAQQLLLQHKILNLMKSLGMIPVLPAFAGHVPAAISRVYPKAQVSSLGAWSNFNCTYSCTKLLEPTDELFKMIGKMFIDEQIQEYNGTNHIYNADTFNEMTPRSNNVSYLANASRAIFDAIAEADSKGIWLMQGWLFHNDPSFWKDPQIKALVTAVPMGRLLVLDLFSEAYPQYYRTHFYYGQPFIWCMLHNFGGNIGFYGKIDIINQVPLEILTAQNSTMVGTGITPEGINQNYIIYDYMLEHGYTVKPANVTNWISNYVQRRYNTKNDDSIVAWKFLSESIYNDTSFGYPAKSFIRGCLVKRPSLHFVGFPKWYNRSSLMNAWDSFAKSLNDLADIETVRYDAVDITRQMLQTIHCILYDNLIQKFSSKDLKGVTAQGNLLLDLLTDFDRILSTDSHFMLGSWLLEARLQGTTDKEKDLYEYNGRNQVSLWGPEGNILDYASKHWASLTANYYWPRWSMFVYYLKEALTKNVSFDQAQFNADVLKNVEKPFTFDKTEFPSSPTGDALETAKELYFKWRSFFS